MVKGLIEVPIICKRILWADRPQLSAQAICSLERVIPTQKHHIFQPRIS